MALKISFKAEAQTEKNGEGVTHKLYIYDPVHGGYDIDPESWEFHTSETSKTVITDLQVTAHTIVPHPKNTLLHVTKALQDAWNAAVQDVKALLNGSKKAHTAANAEAVPWDGITGKPSTFTPSAHNHDDRYYTETEMNTKLNGKANSSHTHTKDQVGLSKVNNNAISMGYDGNLWINYS